MRETCQIVAILIVALALGCKAIGGKNKGPYVFEKANYWGNEIATKKNWSDPQACAALCDENSACKVASFHDATADSGWANTCVLRKAAKDRHADQRGIVSWVKP
jgi:PAN domain-containing protein